MEGIIHDGLLTICTGSSRKTKEWKQKQIAWSKLVERLSQTKRTPETQEQFFKMSKPRQDEIKDVGGFVGGELQDGKRTAMTTLNRCLIALDADFATPDLWDKIINDFDNAICAYSTHKHTPDKPRLRFIIPLDRKVSPDEYQAISRKVAEQFGMDFFDDTTYQPHRLMYYPSSSCDAEFFFRFQDGEWLSADKVLADYDDWQDQTTWSYSSRTNEAVVHSMKKAEDPLAKKGIIGAFCRAYTIQDAIATFLTDVYEEFGADRYTYTAGSSTGGAVVYQDKWLYSFHGTDPCSLQLCNAFDLIRIHKFGDLDFGKSRKDNEKLPSFTAALEFCSKDPRTKILLTKENSASNDFELIASPAIDESEAWRSKLKLHEKTGKVLTTRNNIRIILENDPKLAGCIGYDLFSQRIALLRMPSWRHRLDKSPYWEDSDDSQLRHYLETEFGIDSKSKIDDEIISVAHIHAFHRVRDYLENLHWDGVPRLETLFIDYLGAKDTDYTRCFTRKALIAAVGRIMEPGLKFDNMIVLEGAQGIGKSELLSRLGKSWFSDSLNEMQGKEAYESLRGYWIIEISELEAMKRSDISAVKKFISKKVDSFRVSYGKRTQDFPRQCVFFGTTNEKIFLKDPTGNRRFFPIAVGINAPTKKIFNNPNLDADIDQIWAEAVVAWNKGETVWIGSDMEQIAKKIQDQHTEENPDIGIIEEFLNTPITPDWYAKPIQQRADFVQNNDSDNLDDDHKVYRDKICTAEIWCELKGGDLKKLTAWDIKAITNTLSSLDDWIVYDNNGEKLSFGKGYGLQKAFVRRKRDDDLDF